ncbi:DUF2922 domain-containing protein [Clostridium sp.]|uniref:DUF2922 domain-containing protein n=1 Tax=Clostridium sp. TaxID=1506 RepID=UPI0026263134|nr:DUF2922 domain-containing protein [Clostridium sp.]
MEKELYIVMSFKNTEGKTTNITLRNVREGVTQEEVQGVMDTIVTANIFELAGSSLVSKVRGEVVEKVTEVFEMV